MADDVVYDAIMESIFKTPPAKTTFLPGEWQGVIEKGNIGLFNRPSVKNPEGGESSVLSMSVGMDGKEYLIPRVSDDGRIMTEEEAIEHFKKTGRFLGAFTSPEYATQYADALHKQQASLGGE